MKAVHFVSRNLLMALCVATLLFSGCTDSVFSTQDEPEAPAMTRSTSASKLRYAHLRDRALSQAGKTAAASNTASTTENISLIISANKMVERHKLINRYKLVNRYEYDDVFYGLAAEIDPAQLDTFLLAIETDPDIEWVEFSLPFVEVAKGTTEKSGKKDQVIPWGIERIGATESSTASGDGTGEVDTDIYVLDSGIKTRDMSHMDEEIAFGDFDPWTDGEWVNTRDYLGHGTMVAAIAAADDDSDDVVGVAPGARLHNWKVLNDDGFSDSAIAIAALDSLVQRKRANPATPMVANLSFGTDVGTTEYGALDMAVQAAIDAGIVVVVSAGNEGIDAATVTPAHVEGAITVGAYDVLNGFAPFSNYGTVVDLLAPGADILSVSNANQGQAPHVLMTGTSMAAPHVAGAAALYLSQHPTATPEQVRDALVEAGQVSIWGVPEGTTTKSVWVGDF